jgi:hypothetical protein
MVSIISHRRQYIEINHKIISNLEEGKHVSAIRKVGHGVPSGSILGLVQFLLYINDLPLNITDSKIILFPDDINILVTGIKLTAS